MRASLSSWPCGLSASSRARAASSDSRTVTRSGKRRSMPVMSRDSNFFSRSRSTRVASALLHAGFRQADVDAVLEPQIPAPLADQHRGRDDRAISG